MKRSLHARRLRCEIPPLSGAVWFSLQVVCALACLLPSSLAAQQMQQDYRQFEIDTGASIYASQCVECHTDGTGVPGVNLKTGQFRHALTDEDMLAVIRNGVPGTAMPPHALSGPDLVALVAYVRSMSQDQTNLVKLGDPEKGKALFENEGGCLGCHRVNGKGSRKALNLSDAGTLHPASYLQRALVDPNGTAAGLPESRMVRAVTSKGTVVTGRRLNEDTYTIQLMDDHENLVSLGKGQSEIPHNCERLADAIAEGKIHGRADQRPGCISRIAEIHAAGCTDVIWIWSRHRKRLWSRRQG